MPKNLTGNSALFPTQTSPVQGEPRTAGSAEAPLQNAADRSQYLYDRLMFVDPTREGARRLRRFATIADLKAATDIPTGTVAVVDGVGLYEYDSASTVAELSPIAIKPTVVGGGAGAWLVAGVGSGMLNAPNGVPQLDGAAKVPTSRLAAGDSGGRIAVGAVRNGIINVHTRLVVADYTSSNVLVEVAGSAFTMTMVANDKIIVVGQADMINSEAASTVHTTQWSVTHPSMSVEELPGTRIQHCQTAIDNPSGMPVGFSFTAPTDGAYTFSLWQRVSDAKEAGVRNVSITAIQVRP